MIEKYCIECGTKLVMKNDGSEGMTPYCEKCGTFRFERYSTAVSMIVRDIRTDRILLIKQYGRDSYILVAGYVNPKESLEEAVVREIKEETGMDVKELRYNRSRFFEPSDTLMCNFTAYVDMNEIDTNSEIDSYAWFDDEQAETNIRKGSLAKHFLLCHLEDEKLRKKAD